MKALKNLEFWLVIVLIVVAFIIGIKFYPHSASPIVLDNVSLYHWFSWIGAVYIAVATLVFYMMKRRFPEKYQNIMRFHLGGNLVAFLLISIHFTHQLGTPPILGTYTHLGLTMYTALVFQIATGVLLRYQLSKNHMKSIRFIHVALVTTFYLVVIVHILHGLVII